MLLRVGLPYADLAVVKLCLLKRELIPGRVSAVWCVGRKGRGVDGDGEQSRQRGRRNVPAGTLGLGSGEQRIGHAVSEMLERSITANQQLPPTTVTLSQRVLFGPRHPSRETRERKEERGERDLLYQQSSGLSRPFQSTSRAWRRSNRVVEGAELGGELDCRGGGAS